SSTLTSNRPQTAATREKVVIASPDFEVRAHEPPHGGSHGTARRSRFRPPMSESANFCAECGAQITGGRFCTNCGTPSGVFQAVTPAAVGATTNGEPERTLPTHFEPVAGTSTLIPVVPQPTPPPEPPRRSGPSTTIILIIA